MSTRCTRACGVRRSRRSGFTLIEAICAIVVLSLAVPATVAMLADAARARVDAAGYTRATVLAQAVLEQVCADTASEAAGLGMAALDDPDAYLNAPGTGLVDRLQAVTDAYEPFGLSWTLSIGEPVSADGTPGPAPEFNLYRYVEAVVTWDAASSGVRTLRVGLLAGSGGGA